MRRLRRMTASAFLLIAALTTAACAGSFPESPDTIGADYPSDGIPTSVAWPSDWLEGFVGESDAVGGSIVGLRLDYIDDTWMWRVRSMDPGVDGFVEQVADQTRGREALIDASTLKLVKQHEVELTEAEQSDVKVSYYDAAQLSGETYPSPRVVGLERTLKDGHSAWTITTCDTSTGRISVAVVDAMTPTD